MKNKSAGILVGLALILLGIGFAGVALCNVAERGACACFVYSMAGQAMMARSKLRRRFSGLCLRCEQQHYEWDAEGP